MKYSMPEWIINMWMEYMSYEDVKSILAGMKKIKRHISDVIH